MNSKSRVLETGDNQVTCTYYTHAVNKKAGRAWALGIDIVKYKSQLDFITAHSAGKVIKVIDYLSGTNGVADREGMGYGNYVMIQHSNTMCTLYAHLEKVYVKAGDTVKTGQRIGFMGNTGSSRGGHLHFEIRQYSVPIQPEISLHDESKYEWLDPTQYIAAALPINKTYTGYIDNASADTVGGWLWNGVDDTAERITVRIKSGGKPVKEFSGKAGNFRSDLKAAQKGNGYHAFNIKIDTANLEPGIYEVDAVAPDGTVINGSGDEAVRKIEIKAVSTKAGSEHKLVYAPVYTSGIGKNIGKRSGIYYVHSEEIINGRIRMTNKISRVGKPGQVSFWVETKNL